MGTATQPQVEQYSLSSPPPGASFDYDEVKTDRGQKSLGPAPLLTWDETDEGLQAALAFYGASGVARFINGTSLRVSCQAIARRGKTATPPKSDEQIAKEQLEFRPGSRQGGQSTPASRAASATRKAASVVNGDAIAEMMNRMANDPAFRDQLKALGIDTSAPAVEAEEDGEDTTE